jgi:hypothetical protein
VADEAFTIVGRSPEQIAEDDERRILRSLPLDTRRKALLSERIIAAEAPRDTGRLARSVKQRQQRGRAGRFRSGFEVTAGAVRDGFPYLDVTRFGHQGTFIVPKRSVHLKVHARGRRARPIFRTFVAAYHPARDWVEVGVNRAERAIRSLNARAEGA